MKKRNLVFLMLLLGALAAPLTSRATVETPINSYTATNLGSLGGLATDAQAINDAGQVVGSSRNAGGVYRAFRWENGDMLDLGVLPGAIHSGATAINSQGQIVGWNHSDTAGYRAFLWDVAEGMQELGHLGGASTMPLSINDAGQVTGWSRLANGQSHAFLWQSGQMFDLGTLPGATGSLGYAIDAAGQVAGSSGDGVGGVRAFLWKPSTANASTGAMAALSSVHGEALNINDSQQAVGWSVGPDYEPQPVFWDASGAHPLPLLSPER